MPRTAAPTYSLKLDDQFCFAVYAAARAVVQAYDPLLAELDLTYPQYLVMLSLWETDEVNLKDLGARLYLDSGTLTPLLKRLEGKGFITRRRSLVDERAIDIKLTAAGQRLRERAAPIPHGLACRIDLPVSQLVQVRDELKAILAALHQDPTAPVGPSAKQPAARTQSPRKGVPT
jgi:DNA-binding MarR family transcriptional regulator